MEADLIALADQCRRYQAGEVSAGELSSWAHDRIGHEHSSDEAVDIVILDDEYVAANLSPREQAQLMDTAVAAFLASYPRE